MKKLSYLLLLVFTVSVVSACIPPGQIKKPPSPGKILKKVNSIPTPGKIKLK